MFLPHVKRITSLVSLWLAVMIILAGVLPQSAYAAQPAISIQSEMGYNGYIKDGEWNPLTITLKSDVDVSGEIVVQTEYSYINGSGSYVKKVDLPAGTSKKVILGIPGASFNKGNNTIRFYKGTAQSGEYIPFTVGQSYLASSATASTLIGVLAQDPDSLNFLKTLNQQSQGRDLTVIPLNGEQIPDDSTLLDPLDIIVVNNFSTDSLSSKQITAIRSWVVKGGTLVLAGGSGYAKTVKGLEDISPVEYIGQTDVTSLPQLAIIGGDKPLKFESPFPISQAKPKEGANVSLQAEEDPLFASWLVGKGEVHYAAYDVAMEPLNSWSGHGEVWSTELGQKLSILPNLQGIYGSQSGFMSGLDYILDYFPSLTLPPFSLLVWLLLAYAILVAPILYYVLKKLDKREWAWLFIPLIAVLASGGIYIAGTSGKSSILAHNISIMELDGKGHANRIAGSALFVPRAGDYNLEFAAGTHLLVGREDGLLSGGQTGGPDRQYISVQDEKTTLKLKDMTHRSMAKMWLDTPETREFGKVDIDISYDDQGNPMGNITNNTTSDLSNAALILGGKVFILGDLPKNKSLSIPAATSMPNYGDYGSTLFPYGVSYGNIDEWERERGIINNYFGRSNATVNNVFLAWNKDKLSDYKVDGKSVASEDLNMWVQSVSPKFEANGNVNIPYGLISGSASSTTANELSANGPGRVQMSEGETVFDYILPKDESIEYSYLAIMQSDINGAMTTEFWNNDSEEWEVLSWNNGKVEFNENINSYINAGGMLQIRITTTDWSNFALPEISLKGRK